ncbi:hypothetical protein A8709_02760 [Paenibacillus pectinilyticus]|uniref:VanZ-like domain-containing protein n=1 Tax=Paenibacillus pectinilyticus TaxID=512399 RepID=A0A1C1A790_9BACL|nr:VanZ family protein [Paenibacillus pectinilyticus]OCT16368.1 hypothetical protein A8709_02760 [Paenibacillus pectinilyticus]
MKQAKVRDDIVVPAIFAIYIYAVFKIILFKFDSIDITFLWHQLQRGLEYPGYFKNRLQLANFTPFESISMNIERLTNHDVINLFGNIALFIPFGILLLLMSHNRRMTLSGIFMRSLGLSLSLECLQLVFSMGSFDVDDLILNVSGGILGYGIYKLMGRNNMPDSDSPSGHPSRFASFS